MPVPTIIATPGATNANSYCTRAEADAYHDTRLHSEDWPANVSATATVGSGANGTVTITVAAIGTEGNVYTVQVVEGLAGGALSAVLLGTVLTITLAMDTSSPPAPVSASNTALLVSQAVNAATLLLTSVASGTGATAVPAQSSTSFSGGTYHEETKNPALIEATRLIDSLYEFVNFTTTKTQALQWPRQNVWNRNRWDVIPNTEVPLEIKNATAELARQLIVSDRTLDSDVETQGITSLRAGPVSLTFRDSVSAKVVPDAVAWLIPQWYGWLRERSGVIALMRG